MPQNNDALKWINKAILQFKQDPRSWFLLSSGYFLFIWTQDLVPVFGFIASSIFTTLLVARIFSPTWSQKSKSLAALSVLNFPSIILLTQGFSYLSFGQMPSVENLGMGLSLIFFMCTWLLIFYWSVAEVVIKNQSVNSALIAAWKYFLKNYKLATIHTAVISALFLISMLIWGIGFIVSLPLALATVKASYETTSD